MQDRCPWPVVERFCTSRAMFPVFVCSFFLSFSLFFNSSLVFVFLTGTTDSLTERNGRTDGLTSVGGLSFLKGAYNVSICSNSQNGLLTGSAAHDASVSSFFHASNNSI